MCSSDLLVRKEGKDAFEQRAQDALPLSEALVQKFSEQVDMRSIDGRVRFAELIRPSLDQLPQSLFKDMMQQKVDEIVGINKT